MNRVWGAMKSSYNLIIGIIALMLIIYGVQIQFKLSFQEIGIFLLLICFAILIIGIRSIGEELEEIKKKLSDNPKKKNNPGNLKSIKPSGAGAFSGMIIGATFGLPFGPPGVLVGGILGGIVGNQAEYEHLRKK